MKSRFFSSFPIFILLVTLACAGCYPYGGAPAVGDDARRLLTQARAACERGDPGAFEMLQGRLAAEHPEVARGEAAQRLDARCREELQSAPRIGQPDADALGHLQSYNKRDAP